MHCKCVYTILSLSRNFTWHVLRPHFSTFTFQARNLEIQQSSNPTIPPDHCQSVGLVWFSLVQFRFVSVWLAHFIVCTREKVNKKICLPTFGVICKHQREWQRKHVAGWVKGIKSCFANSCGNLLRVRHAKARNICSMVERGSGVAECPGARIFRGHHPLHRPALIETDPAGGVGSRWTGLAWRGNHPACRLHRQSA